MPTPPKEVTEGKPSIYVRELSRFLDLSRGASHRYLFQSKKKQASIADCNDGAWAMKKDEAKRSKYSDKLLTAFENWVQNCDHVKDNPLKGKTVI